jgi:hypothetical protein
MLKSKVGTALLLVVCLAAASGCMSNSKPPLTTNASNNGSMKETHIMETIDTGQVTVSRSQQFGSVNSAIYGLFKTASDVQAFEDAIGTADRIEGMLDVVRPDYDIVIHQENAKRSYHLWLHPKSDTGMYTEVSDTGTGYRLSPTATKKLKELIMGLEYSPELAEGNKDVVNLHGKWSNENVWNDFVDNVKKGTSDGIHITSYTIEGDPIFQDLIFNGRSIEYTFDNTHDAYGSPMKLSSFCNAIVTSKTDNGTEYRLSGCGEGEQEALGPTFSLLIP